MQRVAALVLCLASLAWGHVLRHGKTERGSLAGTAQFLAKEAKRLRSPELTSLAQEASTNPDAMDKVKDMIRHMLSQKMASQAEDTTHKGFCDKEMVKSKEKVKQLDDKLEKETADLDRMRAELDQLKDEIGDLHASNADAQKTIAKDLDIRTKEKNAYDENKAAYEHSEMSATLHVDGSEEAEKAAEETAEAAMKKRIATETAEASASFKYERRQKELQESIEHGTKEVQDKEHAVVRKNHDIAEAESDLRSLKEEMDASKEYEETITSQCTVRVSSRKERKARREDEIGSLKDAYQMLSGDSVWIPSA